MTFRDDPRVGALGRPGLTRLIKVASGWKGTVYTVEQSRRIRMDWTAGEQSTKHRGKGGGSTLPELPDQLRGWLPFVENLHPRFSRLADSSRSPKCSRSMLSLIRRSRSSNHSQSISSVKGEGGGGRGGGQRGVWEPGGLGGPVASMDWTGPAGGCRRCRHRYRHRQMCTCRPRTLSLHAPPLHPAPCTAEPGQPFLLLPPHQPDQPGHPMLESCHC